MSYVYAKFCARLLRFSRLMGEVGRGLIELSRIIMQEAGIFKIEFSLGTLGTFGMGKTGD